MQHRVGTRKGEERPGAGRTCSLSLVTDGYVVREGSVQSATVGRQGRIVRVTEGPRRTLEGRGPAPTPRVVGKEKEVRGKFRTEVVLWGFRGARDCPCLSECP